MSNKKYILDSDAEVLTDYQDWVFEMWASGNKSLDIRDLFVMTSGLGGEAGEVLEILKKAVRAKKPVDLEHLKEELGDVLYYIAMLCNYHQLSLQDVMQANIDKINVRYGDKKK